MHSKSYGNSSRDFGLTGGNGKGDADRVRDVKAFRDNYDEINWGRGGVGGKGKEYRLPILKRSLKEISPTTGFSRLPPDSVGDEPMLSLVCENPACAEPYKLPPGAFELHVTKCGKCNAFLVSANKKVNTQVPPEFSERYPL